MFESRCGICCTQCERREEVGCTGCVNMKKAFWGGECPVKVCCEEKGLAHCGQCGEFPCALEAEMGKDMGFDPAPRLAACRRWAEEEKSE